MLLEAGRHTSGAAKSLVWQLGRATGTQGACFGLSLPGCILALHAAAAARAGTARPLASQAACRFRREPVVSQWGHLLCAASSTCALALQDCGNVVQEVGKELAHSLIAWRWRHGTYWALARAFERRKMQKLSAPGIWGGTFSTPLTRETQALQTRQGGGSHGPGAYGPHTGWPLNAACPPSVGSPTAPADSDESYFCPALP